MSNPNTFALILAEVKKIPPGQTASYADIAERALGSRSSARTVGWALSKNPPDIPWWRVIRANGTLPGINHSEQSRRLQAEGIHPLPQ